MPGPPLNLPTAPPPSTPQVEILLVEDDPGDLNLPRLGGREVLSILKADPGLRSIPCVVLTTSDAEDDVARSYDLHANAYVKKPVDFNAFTRAVRQIDDFFLTIVRLPQL